MKFLQRSIFEEESIYMCSRVSYTKFYAKIATKNSYVFNKCNKATYYGFHHNVTKEK